MIMNGEIMCFDKEYRWLSNFALLEYPIRVRGVDFNTTENLYQALKCKDFDDFVFISKLSPNKAKTTGKSVDLVDCYDDRYRLKIMEFCIYEKFRQPKFKKLLLDTGNMNIVEGNTWNDTFFGYCLKTNIGNNHLGKIIMKCRDDIREKI